MPHKFYVKDCPDHLAVHDWIAGQSDIYKYVDEMVPSATNKKVLSFTQPDINIERVQSSVESAFDKFGYHGFLNIYGSEVMRDPYYGGLSLVYNPNYKYKDSIPKICHTLGYPRTNMHMGFILENIEVYKGGKANIASSERIDGETNIIKLSSNENAFGPSQKILSSTLNHNLNRYEDWLEGFFGF